MSAETEKSWIGKLWERRIPQFLGTYLAVGFGLLQFLELITNRYDLGSYWVDKYLVVWLALIPAITIMIYFGNQLANAESKSKLRWPKFFIVGNTIVALLLGGFLFNGNASAQSEMVEVTNEEGETVSTLVPSLNKIKNVASFQFENLTGDEENDWLGVAFSLLLQLGLIQRPEFYVVSELDLNGYYDGLGLKQFEVPSMGMQREIAQKSRNDYFTRLSYEIEDNAFIIKGTLYQTRDGKAVAELNTKNADLYKAVDDIKEQIVVNIPDPFAELENQISLPASTLISSNPEALKNFVSARIAYFRNPTGLEEVVALAKKAVELDPTCSLCHFYVGDPLYGQGKRDESISYIKNAIKYGESLPERMQFGAKEVLYSVTGKMESLIKLQELKRKMFPYEFGPYRMLSSIYRGNYGIDSAKFLIQEAIDNGNVEKGLITLYGLQLENKEYEEAEQSLNKLKEEFPDRDQDKLKYATIYDKQGKIVQAREILLEEEMLDPLNTTVQVNLAKLDFRSLEIDKAFKRVTEGYQQATTLSDSIQFALSNFDFLTKTGQISKAISLLEGYEKLVLRRAPINRVVVGNYMSWLDIYQSIGQNDQMTRLLEEIGKYSPESVKLYSCMGNTHAIENGYELPMSLEEYALCRSEYQAYGDGYGEMSDVLYAYQVKDYDKGLEILEADGQRIQKIVGSKYFLSNFYAKAGKLKEAKEIIRKTLDQKIDQPIYYYQMAFLSEKDNPEEAKEHLEVALKFWTNADEAYIPYQRAKALSERLLL